MPRFYVYKHVDGRQVFLGKVKGSTATKAHRKARRKWPADPLDVIDARYIGDRDRGTLARPKTQPGEEGEEDDDDDD